MRMGENTEQKKIMTFRDLKAWQESHQLVLSVYDATKRFPKNELYGLTDQIRRAVVSVTSNIAEGFGRKSYKEKVQFYSQARGSLLEVQNQSILAKDVGYLNNAEFNNILNISENANRVLSGLILKSKDYATRS